MDNKDIYICHTPYQLLITLVKNINNNENDIILCNTIPNYKVLAKNISTYFNNIYIFDEKEMAKKFNEKNIERKIFRTNETIKLFKNYCDIDFKKYNNIYIYNDWSMVGAYLIDSKLNYHLIEDGLNAFYYIKENFKDKITFLNPTLSYKIKHILKKILHMGYDFFGQSKYVIDIEVNDLSKIYIKNENVKEVPREKLFQNLTKKQCGKIYKIFSSSNINKQFNNTKKILLLTQPLYKDKFVKSIDEQKEVYNKIIKEYQEKYAIYIKPHPRDDLSYQDIFKDVIMLDRYMPIEVLNLIETANFDIAVTLCSSSIETLNFVKEKKILGLDFIKERNK